MDRNLLLKGLREKEIRFIGDYSGLTKVLRDSGLGGGRRPISQANRDLISQRLPQSSYINSVIYLIEPGGRKSNLS